MNCKRCNAEMTCGFYIAQTVNKLRDGQKCGSLYPCGPGVLSECLKCQKCGYSVTLAKPAEVKP